MDWQERNELAEAALQGARSSGGGEWLRAECPFCPSVVGKRDTSRAFSINRQHWGWHCFRCGTAGHLDRPAGEDVVQQERTAARIERPEHYLPLGEEPGATAHVTEQARRYLVARRVAPRLWAEARIGACAQGRYAGRVVVPILSGDTWLGWVGRAWSRKVPKPYIYPSGPWRGRALFNHAALHTSGEVLYVVEGVFDALALWPNAVAVLGKPSHEQVEALLLSRRPVVVVLDGDAWVEGWSLAMRLRLMGVRAGSVRLPPKTDPDQVPLADLWEAGRAALASSDAVRI